MTVHSQRGMDDGRLVEMSEMVAPPRPGRSEHVEYIHGELARPGFGSLSEGLAHYDMPGSCMGCRQEQHTCYHC